MPNFWREEQIVDFLIVVASLILIGVWWLWRVWPIEKFLLQDYLKNPQPKQTPGSAAVQPF